jgi:hypothetical protein
MIADSGVECKEIPGKRIVAYRNFFLCGLRLSRESMIRHK